MNSTASSSLPPGPGALAEQLAALDQLGLPDLRALWQQHQGTTAPVMSKELMRLAIGYRMQEEVQGGLSRRAQLQLGSLSRSCGKRHGPERSNPTPLPKAGTRFLREWQGKVHEVLALEDGRFAYHGQTYRSLSVIAREITGVPWSGPRFFGLKASRSPASGGASHG